MYLKKLYLHLWKVKIIFKENITGWCFLKIQFNNLGLLIGMLRETRGLLPFVVLHFMVSNTNTMVCPFNFPFRSCTNRIPSRFLENKPHYVNTETFIGDSQNFTGMGYSVTELLRSLVDKASSLFFHRTNYSVIQEAQNQYCVHLDLCMEYHYHISADVGPWCSFITLILLWKSLET